MPETFVYYLLLRDDYAAADGYEAWLFLSRDQAYGYLGRNKDGAGGWAARAMEARPHPGHVRIAEASTGILNFLGDLAGLHVLTSVERLLERASRGPGALF